MRLLGILFLPAALAFAITYSATRVVEAPQHQPERATSIVWAGRVFETKRDLARWLRARGVSYRVWAQRHPAALGREAPSAQRSAEAAPTGHSGSDNESVLIISAIATALLGSLIFLVRGRSRSGPVLRVFGQATIVRARLLRARTVLLVRGSGGAFSSCGRAVKAARVVYHQQFGLSWYVSGLALLLATCVLVAARM
jgi:hypothetical protein